MYLTIVLYCLVAYCLQKYQDMEAMWQQVADDMRREKENAEQQAASRLQDLNAARDELRQAHDRIAELSALEANWRRRAEAAQQQVRECSTVWRQHVLLAASIHQPLWLVRLLGLMSRNHSTVTTSGVQFLSVSRPAMYG